VLWTGEPWTISVRAESRSDSVPDVRTRAKKRASAADVVCEDESVYAVESFSSKASACLVLDARNSGDAVGIDETDERGGIARCHCAVGITI